MSLATYSDLLSSIASYTKRSDTAPLAPTWIALVESKLNRELRHFLALTRNSAFSASAEFVSLPTDFNALRSARLMSSDYRQLRVLTAEQIDDLRATQSSAATLDALAVVGTQFCFSPASATPATIELLYYADIPPLTASNTANWVLTAYPDLYLWGCLTEASNYYEDDAQLQKYSALFNDALKGAQQDSVKAESSFRPVPTASTRSVV